MIIYKIDVMAALKEAGYSAHRLRQEQILGGNSITQLRCQQPVTFSTLDTVCRLTGLQLGDILAYQPTINKE